MGDIYLGLSIIALLSIFFFALLRHLAQSGPLRRFPTGLALLALCLLTILISESPLVARLLPFSNLIIVGNLVPLAVAAFAGWCWATLRRPLWWRALLISALMLAAVNQAYASLWAAPATGSNVWRQGVSLQTSRSTCSPAAAATLLSKHNITTSEDEMTRLCLTRESGTLWFGLYRGLKLKTASTPWTPQILHITPDELRNLNSPALLRLSLPNSPEIDPRYQKLWGWQPGVSHDVVLLAFKSDNSLSIADPARGPERWSQETLRVLWHGDAIRLVPR